MNELFYHGYRRMAHLIVEVKDPVLAAKLNEAFQTMHEAWRGRDKQFEEISVELKRLQNRFNKLKEEKKS